MKMEQTECYVTLAYEIQTPGNYPEESIQHWEQGESYGADGAVPCRAVHGTAPSAPYTRPTQRLSIPPPIQKLGAENRMLQLNI